MHKLGIIVLVLMLSSIGLAYNISIVDKSINCTCLKVIYLGPDGKNLTMDIYDPACKCTTNNTEISYMDPAGHTMINGVHSPFCHCNTKCSLSCTCLKNLTFKDMVNTSLEMQKTTSQNS